MSEEYKKMVEKQKIKNYVYRIVVIYVLTILVLLYPQMSSLLRSLEGPNKNVYRGLIAVLFFLTYALLNTTLYLMTGYKVSLKMPI